MDPCTAEAVRAQMREWGLRDERILASLTGGDEGIDCGAVHAAVRQCSIHLQREQAQLAEMERQAAEYDAEAHRLREQLEAVGLPVERLSPAGRGALREIAAVASELNLAHTSQPALVAAWTELCLRDMKAAMAQSTAKQQCAALERSLERAKHAAEDTRTALAKAARAQDIDAADNEAMRVRLIDFHNKIDSYKAKEAAMSHALQRKGLKPELKHHALVEASRQCDELEVELQEAQAQLAAYHGLPASQVGAELRLRQLEERCADARSQLQRGMRDLN